MVNCGKINLFLKVDIIKLRQKKIVHYRICDQIDKIHYTNCGNLFYIPSIYTPIHTLLIIVCHSG